MAIKKYLPLLAILFLAVFFRFYNFQNLQYWSADEEIAATTVLKMIREKKISLVSFNTNLGTSIGSYFHILSVPLFLLTSQDPVVVELLTSLLGITSTFFIFIAGNIMQGRRLGLIASFLYAASYFIGLFDRRWWPLSLNPLLAILAVISLYKIIIYKKYNYSALLALSIGFAFHSDPSLAVIAVSALISFLIFKPKILKKSIFLLITVISIFLAPLIFFEIRHPGTIIRPLLITAAAQKEANNPQNYSQKAEIIFSTLGRVFLTKPSSIAENHFCCSLQFEKPYLSPVAEMLTAILLLYPLILILKKSNKIKEKKFLIILYVFLLSLLIGITIYSQLFKKEIHQHYLTVIFPIIALIISYSITLITEKKRTLLLIILIIYLSINTHTLVNSFMLYPLSRKNNLVKELSTALVSKDFSLYIKGDNHLINSGFTELFILQNVHPKKSFDYTLHDWFYKAHGLYTVTPSNEEQTTVVVISESISFPHDKSKEILRKRVNNIEGVVLDNRDFWFKESMLNL